MIAVVYFHYCTLPLQVVFYNTFLFIELKVFIFWFLAWYRKLSLLNVQKFFKLLLKFCMVLTVWYFYCFGSCLYKS